MTKDNKSLLVGALLMAFSAGIACGLGAWLGLLLLIPAYGIGSMMRPEHDTR